MTDKYTQMAEEFTSRHVSQAASHEMLAKYRKRMSGELAALLRRVAREQIEEDAELVENESGGYVDAVANSLVIVAEKLRSRAKELED